MAEPGRYVRPVRAPFVSIEPARPEDVLESSSTIRQADRDECLALANMTAETAMWRGLELSPMAWTGRVDGGIVAIFGVAPGCEATGLGIPWLVGTDALPLHALPFLRNSRGYLALMRRAYPWLQNVVDARNTAAIRWLRWLGFHVELAVPIGPNRVPGHVFWMRG